MQVRWSDDYLTDPKKWIDYTELPIIKCETVTENTGCLVKMNWLQKVIN